MNHCTYDSQHEPKNIKVQGLHGRWDVCLHAVEKNGSREYWRVRNANGVDGEGYWTTRNTAGEYKYFCDAGWGDGDNAIAHLEEELADCDPDQPTCPAHIGPDTREKNET